MKRAAPPRAVALPSLVLNFLLATACSSDAPSDYVDEGPIHDETENCTPVGRSRLFPIIGAFFGPEPGPCTLATTERLYSFHYNTNGVLVRQVASDGQDDIEFHYVDDLLASETRTQPHGVSITTYEYAAAAIRMVTTQQDGAATGYIYEADDRGFIRRARLLNTVTSGSTPTHYTYEYRDCAVQWRVAYDRNDSMNLDATLQYGYDDRGRLTTRNSNISEERFDYSCW